MDTTREDLLGAELLRHTAWIRRLALGLVGDPALAEDLVQDTYLAALRHRPAADQPLKPWLGTVLRNAARQAFRGGARRSARQAEASEPSPTAGPEELAERLETERRLTDELAHLEEPFRSTLMLRYYEGLEPSEIARQQGLPPGTVRWRVKRGLELLRERLDQRFGERSLWSALVLPLARPDAGPPLAGATSATVSGALAMHAITKIGIGAATLAAITFGLHASDALPGAPWALRREAPAEISMRPIAADWEPSEKSVAEPASERAPAPHREASSTVTAPDRVEAAVPAPVWALAARVVDEFGTPIAGAVLRPIDGAPPALARSDRNGALLLELTAARTGGSVDFELAARGYASRALAALPSIGETTYLGTLELAPGGAVSGFVRDSAGVPVAGVEVAVHADDVPRHVLEQQRLVPAETSVPSARTGQDGAFHVAGVMTGYVRVWARSEGYLGCFSPPVEVRTGQESFGLELVLDALPASNRIAGVVLDPEGTPVPGAQLDYRHSSKSSHTTYSGELEADANGRFEFLVSEDTLLWITASAPDGPGGPWGPGSASGVRTGEGELVLWLTRAESVEVAVVDGAGAPVSTYAIATFSADGEFERQSLPRTAREAGRSELRLPTEPFLLRVDAPGFELTELAPLDPASLPDPLVVTLVPLPGLRGSVWTADGPAEGASVSLQLEVPPKRFYERNGFRALVESPIETVKTDADGRFLLTPRVPGRYVVRAEHAGFAPTVSRTLELGPSLAAPALELELTSGGALEGRVVNLDGTDPAGTIVGLSRGDGEDRTLRVGPDGAYRFERLTPGPWLLVPREEELRPGTTVTRTSDRPRAADAIEWSCEVQDGRTTRFDLVLGDRETCVLMGRLQIDGEAPRAWIANLLEDDDLFDQKGAEGTALGPDGAFRLARGEAGRYWLALSDGSRQQQFLLDELSLDTGLNEWELDLETGSLDVGGAPDWGGAEVPAYVHLWNGPGDEQVITVLAGNDSGRALLEAVPAGKGRIVRPDPTTRDFDRWPLVMEVEVRAGQATRVELP